MRASKAQPAVACRNEVRAGLTAVTFLTIVPLGGRLTLTGADVARAGAIFPLVGAGIGAAVGGTVQGLTGPLPALVAVSVGVAAGVVLTGALHVDGLADTADALGGRSATRALEIMRDHAIGSYGGVAILLDLLVRTACLAALSERHQVVSALMVAGALSRLSPVVLAAWLPYARPGDGSGLFLIRNSPIRALVCIAIAVTVAATFGGVRLALPAIAIAAVLTVVLGLWFRRWLGGVTGDTLGAAVEVVEIAALLTAVHIMGAQ